MGRNSNMTKSNETAVALVLGTEELPDVTAARLAVAAQEGEAQGTKRDYARILNVMFAEMAANGELPWFERDRNEATDAMKRVTAEQEALYNELRKPTNRLPKGHSNPSSVWRMIKTYAGEEATIAATEARLTLLIRGDEDNAPLSLSEAQALIAAEAKAASEGANQKRHPSTRYGEEIVKLHRYGESLDPTKYQAAFMESVSNANAFLALAYEAMGFPIAGLKKG